MSVLEFNRVIFLKRSPFLRSVRLSYLFPMILWMASFSFPGIMHVHPGQTILPEAEKPSHLLTDPEEQMFQDYVDALFNSASKGVSVDTTGWCTHRINCDRFDFRFMYDTLSIPLVDSSLRRYFTYPLGNAVTSPFGERRSFWHFGTDIQVNYRDTIRATFDGIVRIVTNDRYGYGNVVVVRHHYGLETLYGHLSKSIVKRNQEIRSGEVIGLGGKTGRATGRHLHFEIRFCGEPFDPGRVLDLENHRLRADTLKLTRSDFEYITDLRKTVFHTIRKGDNLGRIARNYGTTIGKLCRLNGISPSSILRIGRKLMIRKENPSEFSSGTARTGRGS